MSDSSNLSSAPDAARQQTSAGPVKEQDDMGDLKLHLHEVIAEPTDLIKQGTAPPPYFFAFEPSGEDQEQGQKFSALLGVSALVRIIAGMNLVRSGPDHGGRGGRGDGKGDETSTTRHYSLRNPGEYVAAFNEKVEATIKAFTKGPLESMYERCDGGTTTSLDLELTRAELHAMVLPRIFGGLQQVGKTHLAELDKVLTRFTAALKPFEVYTTARGQGGKDEDDAHAGSQPLPELKHAVVVNYVKPIDITGGDGIYIYKPSTRIAIFSVKPQHWASALQKPASSVSEEAVAPGAAGHHHAADAASDATGTSEIGTRSGWFGIGGKPKPKPPKPDERIRFTLNMTILELEFEDDKYHAAKARFEGIFRNMAKDDEELGPIAESGGLEALGRSTCKIYQAV